MSTENTESKTTSQLYARMFLFALIGFAIFFAGAWFRLKQTGAFQAAQNPYAGPPPLMTCLMSGGVGLVFGAVLSIFKRKN